MHKPKTIVGLRHLALFIKNFTACQHFYVNLLGMQIVWQPDADNLYLSFGTDNLALHRAPADWHPAAHQHLDHFGFFLATRDCVDQWHTYLCENNVIIKHLPKDHRDHTRSFYCEDPDGNIVQFIYYPTT